MQKLTDELRAEMLAILGRALDTATHAEVEASRPPDKTIAGLVKGCESWTTLHLWHREKGKA